MFTGYNVFFLRGGGVQEKTLHMLFSLIMMLVTHQVFILNGFINSVTKIFVNDL